VAFSFDAAPARAVLLRDAGSLSLSTSFSALIVRRILGDR
jgi:hypothetical protein